MNRKQLTLLIVVAAVLGGLGWVAYEKQNKAYKESTQKMGGKVLPNFPLNDVEQLVIKQPGGELHLAKKDDVWVVKERADYPANFNNISDLIRKFWDLKVAKPVKVGPSRLPVLELVPPDKGPGTLVEFKDKSGKVVNSVLLGAKSMKESGGDSPFGGGSFPDGRYLMVGSSLESVSLVTEAFSNVEAKPEDWLNKDWFKVEKLKSVSVTTTNATNNWKLSRESETGEWKLTDAKAGELLDNGKSSGATSALSYPAFNDLATNSAPDATGMDKPIVAKLETFDGFAYTVKVGGKSGEDNHYFQVAVAGSFPKERPPGKDEKPEDKEKLDKEFKDSLSKLEEKLKKDKAFEKWTYVVSKWTVDAFLKERKDLLAEKKEEPKPEETKKEDSTAPKTAPKVEVKTSPKAESK
jgi:hypothetical protein